MILQQGALEWHRGDHSCSALTEKGNSSDIMQSLGAVLSDGTTSCNCILTWGQTVEWTIYRNELHTRTYTMHNTSISAHIPLFNYTVLQQCSVSESTRCGR